MNNRIILVLIMLLLFFTSINAQSVGNINDLITIMKDRYASIKDYHGKITMSYGDGVKLYQGEMYYKSPNMFKVQFSQPDERIIVCNGARLWAYYPGLATVGVQDLKESSEIPYGQSKESIAYLLESYSFKFLESSAVYDYNQFKVFKIVGYPKRVEVGFRSITLYVDKTGFIVFQEARTLEGRTLRYYFSFYEVNIDVSALLFNFEIPSNVQVIENIFYQ